MPALPYNDINVTSGVPGINDITEDGKARFASIEFTGAGTLGETEFLSQIRTAFASGALARKLIKLIGITVVSFSGAPTFKYAARCSAGSVQGFERFPSYNGIPGGATEIEFPEITLGADDAVIMLVLVRITGETNALP